MQRLCEQTHEEDFCDGDVIKSTIGSSGETWLLLIIIHGKIRLIPMNERENVKIKGPNTYIVSAETDSFYSKICCDGKTRLSFITSSVYSNVVGESGLQTLLEMIACRDGTPPATAFRRGIFSPHTNVFFQSEDKLVLRQGKSRHDYKLENIVTAIEDYGYIGTFAYQGPSGFTGGKCSIKVMAKKRSALKNMDSRLLQERQLLALLKGESYCIPQLTATIQDSKVAMLVYQDTFMCDLAAAISSGALTDRSKPWYMACVYVAMNSLHINGVIHRSVHPNSIFITNRGVAKVRPLHYK